MKNFGIAFTFALLLGITSISSVSAVSAQSATPGAGTEATDSATTEELRKRIERVVDERREQIKGVVEDLLGKKGAYIGQISRISEEAITVKQGETPTIIPISDTLVILQDATPLSIDKIEVGNWAIVLGTRSDNAIEPEYLIISDLSLRPQNQLVKLGSIKNINRSQLVFIPRGTQDELTATIQRATKFQDSDGDTAAVTEFEADLSVLVTAVEGKDGWELKSVRSLAPLDEIQE